MQAKNFLNIIYGMLLLAIFSVGCKKASEPVPPARPAPRVEAPAPIIEEEPKEKPVYIYQGDKFRDPFLPSGVASSYQADVVFDPKRMAVRAIMVGAQGYNAAVLSQGNAISFYVKSGRIFDVMGKTVQGYSAQVFENRVVLLGEDDIKVEIRIRPTDEKQEKTL